MKNNNVKSSPFSNDDAKNALAWTKDLVERTGTRLTGTKGCKKASEIIFKSFKLVSHAIVKQNFIHNRDAFLSIPKVMSTGYSIAFILLWIGGFANYVSAFIMLLTFITLFFEFIYYKEFIDPLFKKTESTNIISRIKPKSEIKQTLIFSAHYDSPYVFHYLQNFPKKYILILTITMLFYFGMLVLSVIAATLQFQMETPFLYDIFWKTVMAIGLIFIIPYYFFITNEVSPGAGDNLIAVSILYQLAEYIINSENLLESTELIFLITDAEESGLRGARAFVNKFGHEINLKPHYNYNMDSLFSAKKMKIPFGGGGTDSGEFSKAGIESVSLIAMDTTFSSEINPYHTRDDCTENIDINAVLACLQIAHGFACEIDAPNPNIVQDSNN